MVRARKTALLLLFSIFVQTSPGQESIPAGTRITLDGSIVQAEWRDALKQDLVRGGEVFLKHDGGFLYVGLRGLTEGWGHVYVPTANGIHILHASAALGTGIYLFDASGKWKPAHAFAWTMRDAALSGKAETERTAFLKDHHWVASTSRMGNRTDIEFKISFQLLDKEGARLAVLHASDAKTPHYWPSTLSDDCLAEKLIYGTTPEDLHFEPSRWMNIQFK